MSSQEPVDEIPLRIENLTLDLRRRGLYRGSERVHLTPKPFEVLAYLVRNRGRVVPKDEVLHAVWEGHHGHQDDNYVEQAIRQVRRALNDEKDHPRFIQTIPGQGYCFIAAVDDGQRTSTIPAASDVAATNGSALQLLRKYWHLGGAILVSLLVLAVIISRPTLPDPKLANPVRITRSQTRILSPLLTEGSRLYYQRFNNGRYMVAEVGANGGETIVPPMGVSNPELCDIAPDGASLLVRDLVHSREDNEPVYIQPVVGGRVRRIGDILAYDAAWYPDGQHILYTAGGVVYRTDSEGRSRERLFEVPGNAYWFRWSPEAGRLRFTQMDSKTENTSLWEAGADGSKPHRLFPAWKDQQCCGSWTPNGKYFVFQVRFENTFQIWARRERGSMLFRTHDGPVPLALGPVNYRGPLPGKDGRKLFMRTEALKGELVRYDYRSRQFITLLPSVSARTAAFSRDGKWVAYTSLADNNLWRCKSDGSECFQLTHGMQQTALPRWSPDGRTIVFMARRFSANWGVFTIAATGENLQSLSAGNRSDGDPDWSPDGQQVVFGNVLEPSETKALYVLDLRTHNVSTLPESKGFFSPRWSADGRFIVAIRSDNQHLDAYDLAARKWGHLTQISGAYPNWSQDGKHVYFVSISTGQRTVFRLGIQDRSLEKVVSLEAVERAPFMMGDWLGLAPDDSPIAVRNLTTEDIYSWDFEGR